MSVSKNLIFNLIIAWFLVWIFIQNILFYSVLSLWVCLSFVYNSGITESENALQPYYFGKHQMEFLVKDIYRVKDYDIEYKAKLQSIDDIQLDHDIYAIISAPMNFSIENPI